MVALWKFARTRVDKLDNEYGKHKGRAAKKIPKDFDALYQQYMSRQLTKTKMAELCGVSRPLLDRMTKQRYNQ